MGRSRGVLGGGVMFWHGEWGMWEEYQGKLGNTKENIGKWSDCTENMMISDDFSRKSWEIWWKIHGIVVQVTNIHQPWLGISSYCHWVNNWGCWHWHWLCGLCWSHAVSWESKKWYYIPSGKRLHNYGKSSRFMGKLTKKMQFSIAMSVITRGYVNV